MPRIAEIRAIPVAVIVGSDRAFGNARGRYDRRGSIIIEVTADDGTKGWGEGVYVLRLDLALTHRHFAGFEGSVDLPGGEGPQQLAVLLPLAKALHFVPHDAIDEIPQRG